MGLLKQQILANRPYLIGAAVGLVTTLVPLALVVLYAAESIENATPDGGLDVYTVTAFAAFLVAGLLLVTALVSVFVRRTRMIGLGYLSGFGVALLLSLVVVSL